VNCARLEPLLLHLGSIFRNCNESFSMVLFIFGFKYVIKKIFICQLLNLVLGQAKLAIYVSRKTKVEQNLATCLNMVQARILIDFKYYKHILVILFLLRKSGVTMRRCVLLLKVICFLYICELVLFSL